MFIDTHTHLYSEAFDIDCQLAIDKAILAGVSAFVLPAVDSQSTAKMLELQKMNPKTIHIMSGLHPTYVKEDYLDELDHVRYQLKNGSSCAVGEIGIDLYWDKTFLKEQKHAFQTQIQLAKEYNLPIAIHCRDAFDEIFEVLLAEKDTKLRGIFHCFTGNEEQANLAISLQMKLGIGGVVTFKNGKIDQFLKRIDIHDLVLETDAPYLAPVPFRGKRNESAYIPLIAQKVADIYQISIEEVAQITTQTARKILSI